jgi:GAF domain-containing protein
MSDRTPPSEVFSQTPETIERMLSAVRETLRMDVAFVSEFAGDELVFRKLEGDSGPSGGGKAEASRSTSPTASACSTGESPQVVPDARREEATRDLRVTSEAGMGSYCAVPLVLSDGRLYGTLCCVSHEPDPWLRERDLGLMERTARRLVEHLERHGQL